MNSKNRVFPFAAIYGQNKVKDLLMISAVNPEIGELLISDISGFASEMLIKGLGELMPDKEILEVSYKVPTEELTGEINLDKYIEDDCIINTGIFSEADKNIVYMKNINLIEKNAAEFVLKTNEKGYVVIENRYISYTNPAEFTLIASCNCRMRNVDKDILKHFKLHACVDNEGIVEERESLRRLAEFWKDEELFINKWSHETELLKKRMRNARELVKKVIYTTRVNYFAEALSIYGAEDKEKMRALLLKIAGAIAALKGSEEVIEEDLIEAAVYLNSYDESEVFRYINVS